MPPLPVLKAAALLPFEAAIRAGATAVMVGNVTVPGLTGAVPATLSKAAITGLLRRQLGFGGLVLTDSLSARAVQDAGYSVPRAAARSIKAGADMVLFDSATAGTTTHDVIASIVSAVTSGRLPVSRSTPPSSTSWRRRRSRYADEDCVPVKYGPHDEGERME